MKDICKGQIKPGMNPTLSDRKQTVCKTRRETKGQSKAAKKQPVHHHSQVQQVAM